MAPTKGSTWSRDPESDMLGDIVARLTTIEQDAEITKQKARSCRLQLVKYDDQRRVTKRRTNDDAPTLERESA